MAQLGTGFLDPNVATVYQQISEHRARSHIEAEKVEREIYDKLRQDNLPVPPYRLKDFIGKGTYGTVFKADDLQNGRVVAIKMMEIDQVDYEATGEHMNQSIGDLKREVDVLTQLSRAKAPNINPIFDVLPVLGQMWIICEYCPGGSIRTLMRATDSKLEEKYIRVIARELAIGLDAIHNANIMHRDIKPANVMIHENGKLQIIDFGVANVLQSKVDKRGTIIGTPHQMAPELHKRHGVEGIKYGFEIDVWAYAATLYELATGRPPHARTMPGLYLATQLSREPPRLNTSEFPLDLCQFVEYVAQVKPEKRPSMQQILKHPYIRGSEKQYPTKILSELVQIFTQWSCSGGTRASLYIEAGASAPADYDEVAKAEEWRFSTFIDLPDEPSQANDPSATLNTVQLVPSLQINSPEGSSTSPAESLGGRRPYSPSIQPRDDYSTGYESLQDPNSQDQTIGRRSPASDDNQNSDSKVDTADDPHREQRVQRGANALANIFGGEQKYHYGGRSGQMGLNKPTLSRAKSDLPLRNIGDSSDVNPKEVYTNTGEQRAPATGIALADANTIKQRQKQPKRDTMAWEPEYITTQANPMDWEPDYSSAADDDFSSASSTAFPPPNLPRSVTAPVHVNPSRASTASMLDMDALLGEDFHPSTTLSSFGTQSVSSGPAMASDDVTIAPARSRISTVGGHDLDMYNLTTDTSDEEEDTTEVSEGPNDFGIPDQSAHDHNAGPSSLGDQQSVNDYLNDTLQNLVHIPHGVEDTTRRTVPVPEDFALDQIDTSLDSVMHPPNERVMNGQASQDEVAGEWTRLMGGLMAELSAFDEEMQGYEAGNEDYDGDDDSDAAIGNGGPINGSGIA